MKKTRWIDLIEHKDSWRSLASVVGEKAHI